MKAPRLVRVPLAGAFLALVFVAVAIACWQQARGRRRVEAYLQSDEFKRAQAMRRCIEEDERVARPIAVSAADAGRYTIRAIFVWNGAVTVRIETGDAKRDRTERYWVYEPTRGCLVPHPLREKLDWLIDGTREFAILTHGKGQDLVEYSGKRPGEILKNVKFPDACAITANRNFIFVVATDSVWAIDDVGRVTSSDLGVYPMSTCDATDRELIVCSDTGEFGGWLTAWPIGRDGRLGKCRIVATSDFGLNIRHALRDTHDRLWLWGELRHLLLRHFDLQIYRPDGELRNLRNETILRPDAVALDGGHGVLILEKTRGILRVDQHGHAKLLWRGRTQVSYHEKNSTAEKEDEPQGMVAFGGNLYVASTRLGVYEFDPTDSGYEFARQIRFSEN